jgi:hypothetical protein
LRLHTPRIHDEGHPLRGTHLRACRARESRLAETNMISRILSAVVALTYLIIAFCIEGPIGVVKCSIFLLLPLVLIWFPEEMGSFTGVIRGQYINTETPGCLVAFGGWMVLLLPLWVPLVVALIQRFLM